MKRVGLAAAILALSGLAGCVSGYFTGMTKELREHGVAAEATILKIWDTGWTVNNDPVIGMRVEVRPREGSAFEATIAKTLISRIDLPQFQPGGVIPVRYDPSNPSAVAVDFSGGAEASEPAATSGGSGNPYRDRFVRAPEGAGFLPPPAEPEVYLGTADSVADEIALVENGYSLLGRSVVAGGSDLQQAVEQGKAVGAAVVVVYGHFDSPAGASPAVLPLHPRAGTGPAALGDESFVPRLGDGARVALYLGKARPAILGASLRPVAAQEKGTLKIENGAMIFAVAAGSPADAAGLRRGDVLVAIDGKAVGDVTAVPALVRAAAGRSVRFDLIRDGSPLPVTVSLNPAAQ